jgi:hypothetical protein
MAHHDHDVALDADLQQTDGPKPTDAGADAKSGTAPQL